VRMWLIIVHVMFAVTLGQGFVNVLVFSVKHHSVNDTYSFTVPWDVQKTSCQPACCYRCGSQVAV